MTSSILIEAIENGYLIRYGEQRGAEEYRQITIYLPDKAAVLQWMTTNL